MHFYFDMQPFKYTLYAYIHLFSHLLPHTLRSDTQIFYTIIVLLVDCWPYDPYRWLLQYFIQACHYQSSHQSNQTCILVCLILLIIVLSQIILLPSFPNSLNVRFDRSFRWIYLSSTSCSAWFLRPKLYVLPKQLFLKFIIILSFIN